MVLKAVAIDITVERQYFPNRTLQRRCRSRSVNTLHRASRPRIGTTGGAIVWAALLVTTELHLVVISGTARRSSLWVHP